MFNEYEKFEYCKSVGCNEWRKSKNKRLCDTECSFTAYDFHDWLINNGFKIVKDEGDV